jgi:hypothetical protein
MKIRVIRSYDAYEAGQVFEDWPSGMCEILIQRGLIEEFVETADAEQGTLERAAVDLKHKKKRPQ